MDSQIPEILAGRYMLKSLQQQGGMASVYQARDLQTDELVAIKRFDQTRHLPEIEAEAYRREVEALQNLLHPNILKILGNGCDDNSRPFLVLEWMKHDLVELRQLGSSCFDGWDDFADQILMPIVDALAHSHSNGYCHRDVKPANVLIGEDGTPRLADFGISKLKRCLHPRITLNEFMSRPYSPPEPDDGSFSYARDVFAIGVLAVWALSSTPIQSYDDVYAAAETLDVVPAVREVLMRSLSRNPQERQQTASVFAIELARIHESRRQKWLDNDRKSCLMALTRNAITRLSEELDLNGEAAVKKFVLEDINDESTVARFVENYGQHNEKVRAGQYTVLGGTFSYHLAAEDGKRLVVINVRRFAPDMLQRLKNEQLRSPFSYTFNNLNNSLKFGEAATTLELALTEFDDRKIRDREKTEQEQRFLTWQNVLEAKCTFEREKVASIRFTHASAKGHLLTLRVELDDLSGIEIGQPRLIKSEGKWITGDIYSFSEREVVMHCRQTELADVPRTGIAHLDTRAAEIAIDRQRSALVCLKVSVHHHHVDFDPTWG